MDSLVKGCVDWGHSYGSRIGGSLTEGSLIRGSLTRGYPSNKRSDCACRRMSTEWGVDAG